MNSLLSRRRVSVAFAAAGALTVALVIPSVSFADDPSGCDFAPTGTTLSCVGPLSGSTFAGGDGNLATSPTSFGTTDWQNVAGLSAGIDNPSGTSDNSFGQGTKEDNAAVTVVTGSIPPNKSDLTRFYEASETVGNNNFLYLAWERTNVLGSANMDFEINQAVTPGLGTPGSHTIVRTAGDLLVTFDFNNGGGRPVLGLLKWLTAAAGNTASQCFASNTLPCWGSHVALGTNSIGAVNSDTVTDPIAPNAPRDLAALTFGEAAINLTAAGVFPQGTCEAFGSVFLKSRASAAFTAEVKDFVAPVPVNISNCGTIIIHKVTENGDSTFGYTTTGGLTPSTFSLSNGGTRTYSKVPSGSYSVTESAPPTGWTLKSLVCTATGSGTSDSTSGATVSITLAGGGTVECTYTNHTNLSPTISTTLSESTGSIGDSVHDSATLSGATSNAGGTVTYTVYTDNACSLGARDAGTKTVTNGGVPDSDTLTFNSSGTFFWQAVYSGDGNNNPATSACTSEQLIIKNAPTISTTLSATSVAIGTTVSDSSTLSGATGDAGGTVTYTVYTNNTCTQGAVGAGSKTVTNGIVPDSNGVTFNNAGTFYWQAVYSGDAKNETATSTCTDEQLVVNPNQPTVSTAQNLIPNDNFTLGGATATATGTITFSLFDPSDATCSGTPAYTQTVNVNGNGTYSTTNSTFHATAEGTWRWESSYTGDGNNLPATSSCGTERFTIANS